MALTDLQIATLIAKYGRERDRFEKMATIVASRLTAVPFSVDPGAWA
ncbi:hypothetical protein L6V77_32440 [Myxococcota bacterium]|nr:hypothetical protein [Myxococcota bacterium]